MFKKIILATCFYSSLASASEESWSTRTITLPSLNNQIGVYETESKDLRLYKVDPLQSSLQISSTLYDSERAAKNKCRVYGNSLRTRKLTNKNISRLQALVYPLSSEEFSRAGIRIQNMPTLSSIEVSLITDYNSITVPEDARKFEQAAKKKMDPAKIAESGSIDVELEQIDDVICDLILGSARLELKMIASLEIAKPERQVVVTGEQLSKLYGSLRRYTPLAKSSIERSIVNSALLNSVLFKELNLSMAQMGEPKYLALYQGLYDAVNGSLNIIAESQMEKVARAMDRLHVYRSFLGFPARFEVQAMGSTQ